MHIKFKQLYKTNTVGEVSIATKKAESRSSDIPHLVDKSVQIFIKIKNSSYN